VEKILRVKAEKESAQLLKKAPAELLQVAMQRTRNTVDRFKSAKARATSNEDSQGESDTDVEHGSEAGDQSAGRGLSAKKARAGFTSPTSLGTSQDPSFMLSGVMTDLSTMVKDIFGTDSGTSGGGAKNLLNRELDLKERELAVREKEMEVSKEVKVEAAKAATLAAQAQALVLAHALADKVMQAKNMGIDLSVGQLMPNPPEK